MRTATTGSPVRCACCAVLRSMMHCCGAAVLPVPAASTCMPCPPRPSAYWSKRPTVGCDIDVCIASFAAGTQTLKREWKMEWNGIEPVARSAALAAPTTSRPSTHRGQAGPVGRASRQEWVGPVCGVGCNGSSIAAGAGALAGPIQAVQSCVNVSDLGGWGGAFQCQHVVCSQGKSLAVHDDALRFRPRQRGEGSARLPAMSSCSEDESQGGCHTGKALGRPNKHTAARPPKKRYKLYHTAAEDRCPASPWA